MYISINYTKDHHKSIHLNLTKYLTRNGENFLLNNLLFI